MKRFLFALILVATWLAHGRLPSLAQQPSAAAAPRQITFCAYNLKNYLKMERFVEGVRTPDIGKPAHEIAAVIRSITTINPDILGVCEIGADEVPDLQQRLREAGLDLPHVATAFGGDPIRRLGLLSRFPISAQNSQTSLTYQIGQQLFPVARGFLDATIVVRPGWELRCVGVHLKSKREVPEADQALMRRNEAHLLRQHLEGILRAAPQTKVLCYGDFNEHAHEAPIVAIEGVPGMELSLRDVPLRDRHGLTWTHYWDYADVYSRFDYFFVSRALQGHVNHRASFVYDTPDFTQASDHRPIVLKLDLAK